MIWITPENKGEALSIMEECNWPETVKKAIAETEEVVLIPTIPALIGDKEYWAWMKINPYDYRTISVLESGENGAAVEMAIGEMNDVPGQFYVGAMAGMDISIWSVASFSLILSDYDEIMKQAEEMAKAIGKNLGGVTYKDIDLEDDGDDTGNLTISQGIGSPKPSVSYYGINITYSPSLWGGGTFKFTKGIDGMAKGYEFALKLYFGDASNDNNSGKQGKGHQGGENGDNTGGENGESTGPEANIGEYKG